VSAAVLAGSCHCGSAGWTLVGDPGSVTVCNCTRCRRYGALWAYDFEGERVAVSGPLTAYRRPGKADPALEMLFCPGCGSVVAWRGLRPEPDDRRRMAINIRLAPPEAVADLAIDRFDGLESFEDLPADGRTVGDYWF
jgi:hypothetical protein